ncbi:uncharacterized protein LOC110837379 isoform X2 [Zootermopsis nevadensis]|nr:uncharacterized protein LOC110837379 isoform X2 [Zootermopsis nevadensis]
MSIKPPFIIPNPDLQFMFFALMLLLSFTTCPVNTRPSPVDNPHHHHVHHDSTDILLQQSEDMSNESQEQFLTEIKISEEQDFQDEFEDVDNDPADTEDYPQQDMPAEAMGDAAGITGGRKGETKLPKTHLNNGKSGKRNAADHSVAKPVPEGNDTNDGIPEDVNLDELNKTLSNSSVFNTTTSDENYIKLSKNNRERNKVLRINAIKEMIQNYRQGSVPVDPRPTNVPIDELVKLVNLNISHPSPIDAYPMKRRSFHPSCNLPNNTDVDMWVDGNSMNLLFNLTYPAQQNVTITIIAATLRLYKFTQGNHTVVDHSCSAEHESEEEQEHQEDNPVVAEVPVLPQTPGTVMADDDKQIRVSVYWYTRSLKKNKVKRKLLDSRMLPIYGKGGWIEFNVRHAARQWRLLGKNFGLVVEVENEDGDLLKASDYFTAMNCSNEASTARPLPGVLLQAAQTYLEANYASARAGFDIIASGPEFTYTNPNSNNKGETDIRDEDDSRNTGSSTYVYSFLFPVIDMCTIEVSAQEAANAAFLQHAQYLLTQQLAACKNRNTQNHTDLILMHGTPIHTTQVYPMTIEENKTGTLEVNNKTEEVDNISHEGHRKDHRHNGHHASRLDTPEELLPSMQDSPPRAVKIRHSRHHHLDEKHRPRNQSGSHHVEDTVKRRVTNGENEKETEEIKQVTWADESGREFSKEIIIQEVIRSANPLDSSALPQQDSDR